MRNIYNFYKSINRCTSKTKGALLMPLYTFTLVLTFLYSFCLSSSIRFSDKPANKYFSFQYLPSSVAKSLQPPE